MIEIIRLYDQLIQLYENQIVDLTMMSKIELGDDVIAEIVRIKSNIKVEKYLENPNGTDNAKSGAVLLDEFIVRWDYNGDGKITVSLNDAEDKLIQSIEHVKSKI